jgi:hypothetical protein
MTTYIAACGFLKQMAKSAGMEVVAIVPVKLL